LYFILLWCVFSFKVLLGGVQEAGIRVDDLLIVVAFVILLLRGDLVRIPRSGAFRAYLIFVSISFLSAAWNGLAGRVNLVYSMLFVIRLFEYMVFYYLGYALLESGIRVWSGLKVYFYVLCIAVPLQMIHLLPTASRFGLSRATGNTNGPYELAAVAVFFLCYFGYQKQTRLNAGLSFVLLLLTASRITFAGAIIAFLMHFASRRKFILTAVTVASLAVSILLAAKALIPSDESADGDKQTLTIRLNNAYSLLSADYVSVFAAVPTYTKSYDYFSGGFLDADQLAQDSGADASGMIRAFRWSILIKSTMTHFDSIAIGLGPSFGSSAVDGYFVRVFIETGLVGLVAFVMFLRSLTKWHTAQLGAFRDFAIILIVTACFIDIFASYKTMLLLWLWNGMNEFDKRRREVYIARSMRIDALGKPGGDLLYEPAQ
jgi:hypothetical protein